MTRPCSDLHCAVLRPDQALLPVEDNNAQTLIHVSPSELHSSDTIAARSSQTCIVQLIQHQSWTRVLTVTTLMVSVLLGSTASPALAEWSATAGGSLFYTDDTALFSATRHSSLDGDPSQPVLDVSRTGVGSDMVFEPTIRVMKYLSSSYGRTAFIFRARGFMYAVSPEFSQANLHVEAVHAFNANTAVHLRYFSTPGQLLGQTEELRTDTLQDMRVTSNLGSIRLDHRLSEHFEVQLYGRAGIRRFNEPFRQRDTLLWTVGPHLVWHVNHAAKVILGYHYERGLAEGRHDLKLHEDISYVHHFAAVGLEMDLLHNLELELDFHYERNNLTSGMPEDEHFNGHDNIFQGNGRLFYQLTDHMTLMFTIQRVNRQQSFFQTHNHNTNVSAGLIYRF